VVCKVEKGRTCMSVKRVESDGKSDCLTCDINVYAHNIARNVREGTDGENPLKLMRL
jgi:hypothetical protein